VEGVRDIEKCPIRKAGHNLFVDIHVQVDPQMTVVRAHDIAHQVKDQIKSALPQVKDVLVHIEPHGHRGE
jgi:divalent metal cation (Fe/Co/Zn/Cd) transporter